MERRTAAVIGVDTGGTFTDVFASSGRIAKVPSTPRDPVRAILAGLGAVGLEAGDAVGHGTTVATNAVLERKGARTVLLTTRGFEDVLAIRRQNRPSLYDLRSRWPDPLVPRARRLGVDERLDYRGQVLRAIDRQGIADVISDVEAEVEAIAVCLLFSYVDGVHERGVRDLIREKLGPDFPVSLSHEVAPQYGEYERTSTTVLNAYVMPVMGRYLAALGSEVMTLGARSLHVMQSGGGLISAQTAAERPIQTILSGPAAGVVGAWALATAAGEERIITLDMGGTSTDVALVPGSILESNEGDVAGFPLLAPMLTIETVGAGGGSIARIDAGGGLHVGPESAGADPGPAAYGLGSRPTVTDANLVLGRLSEAGLLGGEMPLHVEAARASLEPLAARLSLSIEQVAWAVIRLVNSNMDRAVRAVSLQRGHDPRDFTLFAFGGAGPLHAAELAESLGITRVLIPPHPGVMAALGLTVPDFRREFQQSILEPLVEHSLPRVQTAMERLEALAMAGTTGEALFGEPVLERSLDLRYVGQSFELRVPFTPDVAALRLAFGRVYDRRYGYAPPGEPVEIVHARVRALLPRLAAPDLVPNWPEASRTLDDRVVWFGRGPDMADLQEATTPVAWRPSLPAGTDMVGPSLIEQYDSATLIPPGWQGRVDEDFNLTLVMP